MAQDAAGGVAGFESSVRRVIIESISRSFQSISLVELEAFLGLKGPKLLEWVKSLGWTQSDDGKSLQIPINKDNEAKSVLIKENLPLSKLTKIVAHAASPPS